MKKKPIKCFLCGATIPWAGKGRKPRYCRPSHRQRAYEARKLKKIKDGPFFAFKQDLAEFAKRDNEGRIRQVILGVLQEEGLIPQTRQRKKAAT